MGGYIIADFWTRVRYDVAEREYGDPDEVFATVCAILRSYRLLPKYTVVNRDNERSDWLIRAHGRSSDYWTAERTINATYPGVVGFYEKVELSLGR